MQFRIFTFLLLLSGSVIGQTSRLTGRIFDQDTKLPLPGATVSVAGSIQKAISNTNGTFDLGNLTPGAAELQVSYIGYQTASQRIQLVAGQLLRQDVYLRVGQIDGQEVIIIGDRLRGQAKALNQQRTNANVTNVVSADQIGRFPDANIGDALKRIPGITMQNDQGEARDIIIRGMAPQLNSVTLNGERVPSAEGDNRRVQMDLIPADMIQTIQVNKAVLPDMDADAIGGSVNLVTRQPSGGLRVSGTLGSGVNMLTKLPMYTGALVLGNRFLNNRLGMVLSGSYHNHNFGSDNVEAVWVNPKGRAVIDQFDIREYRVQRVRRSASANFDYEISPNHVVALAGMYNWRDDWENRFRMRVSKLEDAFKSGSFKEISANTFDIPAGRVEYQTKGGIGNDRSKNTRLEDQRTYNLTLSGKHQFNRLRATWNITTAQASEERPNERYISFRQSKLPVRVTLADGFFPNAQLQDPAKNLGIGLNAITEQYSITKEKDWNARLDFSMPYSTGGVVKFGGRFRDKAKMRDRNFFQYTDNTKAITNVASVENANYTDPEFLAGSQYAAGVFATPAMLGALDLASSRFKKTDVPTEYVPSNYQAHEQIQAGYLMADHQFTPRLSAVAGLRYEYTSIDYTGNNFDEKAAKVTKDSRTNTYGNWLPGVHLKYDITKDAILRMAWTNTIARPNYFDLVPYAQFNRDDATLSRGNPSLKPTRASNLDLMFEKYYRNIGIVSAGGFYKQLNDFIYSRTLQNYTDATFGQNLRFTTPENGGKATLWGLEAAIQRQLWKGLGIYLNYTFTNAVTTGIQGRESEKLTLPGTARHMFNGSVSYETRKLVTRIALNYANDYLDALGSSAFGDLYYDRQLFLDINASYAITPQFRVFLEGNNLTNQPLRYYQGVRSQTAQVEYYQARFQGGIKFDLTK